ncbi:MAG: choice-of-anchor J domain-containing protein [Bacteroidetes bacterium]|nr:choice-of-anchor J domain-containing protein [Bacteroidota bacterium]
MKKLFTLFILTIFVSLSLESFAQTAPWVWQHETPQGNTLRYVKYWDANNWYAAGYNGTFMKTTNAGANWTWKNNALGQYSNSGQANWCYGAYFFNQNTGIILGQGNSVSGANGIFRTTNGGTTFDTTNVVPYNSGTFYFANFVNNNLGFAGCTAAPYIYRTTNGGMSWTGLTSPTTTAYDVYASDSLNIIIANTTGNVRKSTDGGATWTTISTGASATLYRMVFANANTGFTAGGTTAATMFRYTTNGGLNWTTPTNTGLPASTMYDIDVKSVSTTPATLKLNEGFEDASFPPAGWSTIHVLGATTWIRSTSYFNSGTASAYITYESSGAENWLVTKKVTGIAATDSLVFFWKNAFSSAYPPDSLIIRVSTTDSLQASFTNVVASIDASAMPYTWTRYAYSLSAFAGQNVFIAFEEKNTDGNGGYLDDVQILPAPAPVLSATVYMTGNSFAIYRTTNTGATWDTVGFLSPTQPWTSTFYSTDLSPWGGDTLLTVGTFGFINRRAGSNFTEFTNVQKPGTIYDVWAASSTGNVITVGAPTSTGGSFDQIMKSTNGGTTWAIVPYSTTSYAAFNCIQMLDANTGYVSGSYGSLYRTTNGGNNWDSVAVEGSNSSSNFKKVHFVNANTGWVFTTYNSTITDSATIFKTTNAGVNWTKQYITETSGSYRGVYGAYMVDANTGWLISYHPRPWRTTNGGSTWTLDSISDGFSGFMYDIKMFSATNGYIAGSSGRFYKLNANNVWDTISVPSRNFSFYGLDFVSPSSGYLFGSNGVVYATTNGGTSWTNVNTQGSTMYNGYITPDFKAFCVGASGQIFKNNNVLTNLAGNTDPLIPTKYSLDQNYPNPFNPTTTIKFGLPKDGMVTIKIYDVAGREVMRLIDNQSMKAGFQTTFFNASHLASGVYFYSLVIDSKLIGTKKMVLIK